MTETAANKESPRLLLVEDDEDSYDMLMRRLEGHGYDVDLALDGEEAVDKAQLERPDLILMDLQLPEMNGYEATQRIREFEEGSSVPIIALTSHALREDKNKALASGFDDHHAKPVFFTQLLEQIEALLQGEKKA